MSRPSVHVTFDSLRKLSAFVWTYVLIQWMVCEPMGVNKYLKKNMVGGENQIICITQAQTVPDRFRYTSNTDAAEDLSDTRIKCVSLTSWQERHL